MYGFKKGAKPEQKEKLRNGGMIQGPGTGTSDSIKTDIPKGSYIMPADSTKQVGAQALGELGKPVPANVSNGEYQMPPEQVHAVGVQALNQMRDATHAPAAGFTPQPSELYFADGGSPAEEERRRQAMQGGPLGVSYSGMTGQPQPSANPQPQPRSQPAAGMRPASYSDLQRAPSIPRPSAPSPSGAINTATPARPSAPAAQPAAQAAEPGMAPQMAPATFSDMQREPSIPRSGQPRQMPQGEQLGMSGVTDGLQAAGQRAAAGIQGTADQVAQAGRGFVAGGQAMTDQAATAAGSAVDAASGALNYLNRGDPVRDAIGAVGGLFSRSAQQARQADYGATGAPSSAAPAPAQATPSPVAQSAPAATTPIADQPAPPGATPPAPAARAGYGFTPANQQGPAPGMRVSPTSAPEIQRIDNAPGLNSPLFTNLPAGEAVSGMQGGTVNTVPAFRAPASAQAGGAAQGFWQGQQGPAVSVIGDSRRTERDRYGDLMKEVAKLSQGGRAGRNKAAALVSAYAAAQRGEEADMRDQAGARELGFRQEDAATRNAQSARELQERSADRTGRLALDERRLSGEEVARGFEARGLQRVEKLYQQLESAQTPEERAAVTEQLRALSGKEAPNRFTVVPGGQELSPQGMPFTRPSMVFNNQTGQFVDLGAAQQQGPAQATRPVGTTSTVNGKTAVWDGSKWVPR